MLTQHSTIFLLHIDITRAMIHPGISPYSQLRLIFFFLLEKRLKLKSSSFDSKSCKLLSFYSILRRMFGEKSRFACLKVYDDSSSSSNDDEEKQAKKNKVFTLHNLFDTIMYNSAQM